MKPEEFLDSWEGKKAVVTFEDGLEFIGRLYKTNPADNDEEEGDTVFIWIWQDTRIIEEPIEAVKTIRFI